MIEDLRERTKNLTTWADLRKEYFNLGIFGLKDIELEEKFSEADAKIFEKYERGEITKQEFDHLSIELDHEHTRACREISGGSRECDEWLTELDEIVLAHDAGEISAEEYWRLCFELDKKFGLADEEDADIYLGAEDEENFSEQISARV